VCQLTQSHMGCIVTSRSCRQLRIRPHLCNHGVCQLRGVKWRATEQICQQRLDAVEVRGFGVEELNIYLNLFGHIQLAQQAVWR
jgi:hypothetical protein